MIISSSGKKIDLELIDDDDIRFQTTAPMMFIETTW